MPLISKRNKLITIILLAQRENSMIFLQNLSTYLSYELLMVN